MTPTLLNAIDARYPARLRERLGTRAPSQLTALGNLGLIELPKTALFCSARCPGDAILRAYDQAAKWRDEGRCVISGFHSPVEKECLRILLRLPAPRPARQAGGRQPIIICPARALPKRLPAELTQALADNRLLLLSCFKPTVRHATTDFAARRNELIVALADEVWFVHISPGGQMERLDTQAAKWSSPSSQNVFRL